MRMPEMRVALEIVLADEERIELSKLARSQLSSIRLVQRARIVLLAADGTQNKDIAQQLGMGVCRFRAGASGMQSCGRPGLSVICRGERRQPRSTSHIWWH
jgi:hypothetical protein